MSSGSESDEEYVPGEPEHLSEEESADDETDKQYDKEIEYKAKKRKAAQEINSKKKRRTRGSEYIEPVEERPEKTELSEALDPEEEKKKADDLWAKFLDGTDTKPKPTTKEPTTIPLEEKPLSNDKKKEDFKKDDMKTREQRIFEFAGETIVVENNVIKEKIKTTDSPAAASKLGGPSRSRSSGGLSGVLGALNKKNKLSTLEKSKLDWDTYKHEEGIEEEIKTHNKGKGGYLDRKDFLERADVRQYEIERDLRMSRRSNR